MGKPFGLLKRILSISKASKRSEDSNLDRRTSANELGQELSRTNRTKDDDDGYILAGSVRTTGGIGGLGSGITNAASEITGPSRAASTSGWKRGDHVGGMKKRRLKRASLSASNLLSWGQERVNTPGKRILSESGRTEGHQGLPNNAPGSLGFQKYNETNRPATMSSEHQARRRAESTHDGPVNKDTASSQVLADEQFTRILRSSSSNYKILNKVDYWNLGPIEHPIDAIKDDEIKSVLYAQPSEGILSPNMKASLDNTLPTLTRPLQRSSTLTRAASIVSTTSTSAYKVTIHRRRVHSRISFPDANRALELLHATPSNSMSSSIEESPCASTAGPNLPSDGDSPHVLRDARPLERMASAPLPSLLAANEALMLHKDPRHVRQMEASNSVRKQASSISQIRPVSILRASGPQSQRTGYPSSSINRSFASPAQGTKWKMMNDLNPINDSHKSDAPEFRAESGVKRHYTIPLKVDNSTTQDLRNLGSGLVEKASLRSFRSQDTNVITISARKERNVLQKKRRKAQTSPVNSINCIDGVQGGSSQSSLAGDGKTQPRSGSLHSALTVSTVHRDIVTASAKDKHSLGSDTVTSVKGSSLPVMVADLFSSGINTPRSTEDESPIKHKLQLFGRTIKDGQKLFPSTPRDKLRIAGLRKDPSVISLLSMYDRDGTIAEAAFSNSPVRKESGHLQPIPTGNLVYTESLDQLVINTMQNKEPRGLPEAVKGSKLQVSAPTDTSFLSEDTAGSYPFDLDHNVSMMAEWGSLGIINESQANSMELSRPGEDIQKKITSPMDTERLQGTRPSNRRASEVFAFLNPQGLGDHTGDLSEDVTAGHGGRSDDDSSPAEDSSPSRRALSLRTNRIVNSSSSKSKPSSARSKELSGISLPRIEGEVSNNDSFASQNTTDRSIYRGIYTHLKNMSVSPGVFLTSTIGGKTMMNTGVQSVTPMDTNKSLPSTPPSSSRSTGTIDLYQKLLEADKDENTFIPLPAVTPLSPLHIAFGVTSPQRNIKSRIQVDSPSPYFKKTVKERIAKWESTHPLIIAKQNSVRRNGSHRIASLPMTQNQNDQHSLPPAKFSEPKESGSQATPHKPVGLGDGRTFNANSGRLRLHGPRVMPSPASLGKVSSNTMPKSTTTPKPVMKEATLAKDMTSVDLVYGYPLPEELFPNVIDPASLVAATNDKLGTPRRPSVHGDPSPASSSKLGVYGREIMAVARSRSTRKVSGDSEQL
ncbi:hypothetical protein CPB86DRAFT_786301 [Serendipita vermifera]|nr:hypothetical protein CPB86DRAFT_786301 [Serendipita vermifera]